MSSIWKKFFIPHEGNEYKPHSLRVRTVISIFAIALLLYGLFSFAYPVVLERTGFTAIILPAVLVDLTNEDRVIHGASSLQINPLLVEAAQLKANDMAAKSYFAHTSPEGITPWYWFNLTGYEFNYAGENLAVNFTDSEEVTKAWMASPGHRANILNGRFGEIGIATAKGVYNGYETVFVVQLFGTPASQRVKTAETEPSEAEVKTEIKEVVREEVKGDSGREEFYIEAEVLPASSVEPVSREKGEETPQYASEFEKTLATPNTMLKYIYGALILFVFLSLLLSIFIEIRRQHPKHIFYGILLLVILGFFVTITKSAILSPLIIR